MVGGIIGKGLTLFDPTIEQLADVSAPTPNDGDVITYQASTGQWVSKAGGGGSGITAIAGDVSASGTGTVSAVVVAIQNTQISAGTIADNQVLTYKSAKGKWVPRAVAGSGTVTSVGVSALNGINVSGSPITGSGTFTFKLGNITPTTVNTGVVSATSLNVTGDVLAATGRITASAATISSKLTGATAAFSGMVSADAGIRATILSADSVNITGDMKTATGRVTASAATITSLLTGATASFSGKVSADAGLNTTVVSAASLNVTGDILAAAGRVTASAATLTAKLTGQAASFSSILSADGGFSMIGTAVSAGTLTDTNALTYVAAKTKWCPRTPAGSGTVTSAGISVPVGMSASGTPITSQGVFQLTWAAPVSVAYNGTTNVDATQGSYFRGVAVSAFTLSAKNAYDGQKIIFEIIQDGTGSRVMTPGSTFKFGTDISAATLTTTASARDFVGGFWNASEIKLYITAFVKGY